MPQTLDPGALVPLGQAGTGDAVILGSGLQPLNVLRQQDALNARRADAAAKLRQQQENEDYKAFSTGIKLGTDAFLPWQKQVDTNAKAAYDRMVGTAQRGDLDRYAKRAAYQKEVADHDGIVNLTKGIEEKTKQLVSTAKADKRYNAAAVEKAAFQSFYGPDQQPVDVRQYDPAALDAVAENPEHFNVNEVVTQFVKNSFDKDSTARATAARPGGTGVRQVAESNLFELNPDGSVKIDPVTRKEVMKVTDATLQEANNDPFLSKVLDKAMADHHAAVEAAAEKQATNQPLSEQEKGLLDAEAEKPTTQLDLLKDLLLSKAYARTQRIETYRAEQRPRAAARGGQPGYRPVGSGGGEARIGAVNGASGNLAGGFYTPYQQADRVKQKRNGEAVPYGYEAAKHRRLLVQEGDKIINHQNNNQTLALNYQGLSMVITNPATGNILLPGKDVRTREEFLAWAKRKTADPAYKGFTRVGWAMQATNKKGQEYSEGNESDVYQQLKGEEESFRKAVAGDNTALSGLSEEAKALVAATRGGGRPPRFRSDAQLQADARDIVRKRNARYYIPYDGAEQRDIDTHTEGAFRPSAQEQQQLGQLNAQIFGNPRGRVGKPAAKATGIDWGGAPTTATPPAPSKKKTTGITW